MRRWHIFIYIAGIILVPSLSNASICEHHTQCKNRFIIKDKFLTYYSTHKINEKQPQIKRLVIVIHGALRNGDEYFDDTVVAAKKFKVDKTTMVLAPTFRNTNDQREEGELYWGSKWYQKWKYGYVSQDNDSVSSYEVIDSLIQKIATSKNFANLTSIVVTGHSAGGQFTQRYGVSTVVAKNIRQSFTIVPSNPSSYMYLDETRYEFFDGNFQIKDVTQDCPEFNDYIYGPMNRASYMQGMSIEELRSNFGNQNIVYLMSEEDKGLDSLDQSCEARIQGKHRFERAKNFYHYVKKKVPSNNHRFISIPGIGHDHLLVYGSSEAERIVFGKQEQEDPSFHYLKIGNRNDVITPTEYMFVMFGGGKNEIAGMKRFITAANGGDLLVISGKDILNHRYTHDFWNMSEQENIPLNSVQTISFLDGVAGEREFVINKIKNAEAIFFTGGDQSKYINRIKGTTAYLELLNKVRIGIAIAGTSAGLAIMGEYIFSAQSGGVRSDYVLAHPHSSGISIEHDFFYSPLLRHLVTDTHFAERGREGRLLGFMFKGQFDYAVNELFGVGIDEQTSLTVTTDFKMLASGKGDVVFYKAPSIIPTLQTGPLNYGPVLKQKIQHDTAVPHFSTMKFFNSINVLNGVLKESSESQISL